MGESSITYPNGLCPGDFCKNLFEIIFNEEDLKRYQVLRSRAFTDIITEFKTYNITKQEYVLLKTILFCNSIPENISQNSKNLLKLEAERYGQILIKYLQNLLGEFDGAMRHANCLLFIGKIFEYNIQQNMFCKMVEERIFNNNEGGNYGLIMERPIFVEQCLFKFTS
uniref:NR LBD domain-containing protein n=1 Tax=Meloidogyne incognita TaxID=6306 RepID=A0A914LZ21_MELIC